LLDPDSLKGWWDALTGIGTVSMAIDTFIVVRQGRRQRKDDDQRHRDALRPICVLTPYDGVDPQGATRESLTETGQSRVRATRLSRIRERTVVAGWANG
jgi:hypothetical protein